MGLEFINELLYYYFYFFTLLIGILIGRKDELKLIHKIKTIKNNIFFIFFFYNINIIIYNNNLYKKKLSLNSFIIK